MDVGLALQYAGVGVAVAGSVLYVFLTRFPGVARRVRTALAIRLIGSGVAPLARLGRAIAPVPRGGAGCAGCDGCD